MLRDECKEGEEGDGNELLGANGSVSSLSLFSSLGGKRACLHRVDAGGHIIHWSEISLYFHPRTL